MRMARLHTGRHKVLATYRSYHGATAGLDHRDRRPAALAERAGDAAASSTSGARTPTARPSTRPPRREECERALQHLRDVIMVEGPSTIAAVILETVVGTNGILVPPDGYLAGVREICDEHGIVWIADEVMAGFGRCGEWFAVDRWGVTPDLICFAKGVNSGYVPLGGVVISDADRRHLRPSGPSPAASPTRATRSPARRPSRRSGSSRRRASSRTSARSRDTVIAPRLAEIAEKHPSVGEVRGLGFFWALELVRDRATREPLVPYNAERRPRPAR